MTCHNCWCPTCNAERALWALKPFAPYIPNAAPFPYVPPSVPYGPGVAPLVFGEPVFTPNFTGAQAVGVGSSISCTCGLQDHQTCSRAGCPRKMHR